MALKVVAAKSRVVPAAPLIGPLLTLVPAAAKRSERVCTSTVPVFTNGALRVATPLVKLLRSVPALENDPPPPKVASVRSPRMSNTEPAGLLRAAPLPTLICPPVQLAVPLFALTSSRPLLSVLLDPMSVMPAWGVVVPSADYVPPLHVH